MGKKTLNKKNSKGWFKMLSLLLLSVMVMPAAYYYYKVVSYNHREAVEYITLNAEKKPKGLCSRYVRKTLIADGLPAYLRGSACCYDKFLPLYGFREIDVPSVYRKGDIVVFPSVKNHRHGHIAMWNGRQWVSDFKQRNIIVNNAYRGVAFKVLRHKYSADEF